MASQLYSIFIFFYSLGIRLAALFTPKAKKFIQGRSNLLENLESKLNSSQEKIWIHCASVGEFEQAIPLWQKLRGEYPKYQFVFSFFSPSGYEYVVNSYPNLTITYLPLDSTRNANEFVQMLNPKLAIFIKYEFWRNHLLALNKANIPTFLVSGIFRKNQMFFKPYGSFFRKSLSYFTHFFVQNEESMNLLESIHINNATITGDTRYERVIENKSIPFSDKKIEDFIGNNQNILICGSVWESDLEVINNIEKSINNDWKIILVPHEPNHFQYHEQKSVAIYSEKVNNEHKILIIDQLGMLSKLYRYATVAYVGGGFGKGIHNILEAAIYKIPVIIGPNFKKFQEAKDLIDLKQVVVTDKEKTQVSFRTAMNIKSETIEKSYAFMTQNANASDHILVFIKKHSFL